MKKIITTGISPTSRMPFTKPVLDHLQEGIRECLSAILNGLNGGSNSLITVFYGCVATGNNVSAGAVFYGGEIFLVDPITVTDISTAWWVEVFPLVFDGNDPLQYSDSVYKSTLAVRKFTLQDGTGLVPYGSALFLDSLDNLRGEIVDTVANLLTETTARSLSDTSLANLISAETVARSSSDTSLDNLISAETVARSSSDTSLYNLISAEAVSRNSADNLKANSSQPIWIPLTLLNGAVEEDYVNDPCKYRISTVGVVEIVGKMTTAPTVAPSFVMPSGAKIGSKKNIWLYSITDFGFIDVAMDLDGAVTFHSINCSFQLCTIPSYLAEG